MSLFATCWIWKLSLQVSGLFVVYTIGHFHKCQHTLTMFPSLSQTTTPRFGDRGDGPKVRVTTGVKNAHTVFTRHKLDQEMILLHWSFHTLCWEGQHYAILGKLRSMRCNIWSVQGVIVQYGRSYFHLYKIIFRVIQQGNKQVYNYSFEECFKRVNKH